MSFNLDQYTAGISQPPIKPNTPDEASVNTRKAGEESGKIDADLTELTLRFEYEPTDRNLASQFPMIHINLLKEIQRALEDEVIIFNNKGNKIGEIDLVEWGSPTMHQRNFKLHVKPGNQRRRTKYLIIHRVHTTQTLSSIRQITGLKDLLQAKNCYLRAHAWDETVVNLVQAGHSINCNPQHYTPEAAMARIQSEVRAKNPKAKLPPIRLIYASLRKDNLRSKAYAIEFAQEDAQAALRILKDTYTGTNRFLLARMRHTNPDAYCKALKMQNQHLSSAYVIPLLNIPEAAMFYLRERLLAIEGVKDVVTTRHTETTGRYNILVDKDHFKNAKQWLTANFTKMYADRVPNEAQKTELYGNPCVGGRGSTDEDSFGDQSFLSMSAASFASVDTATFPDTFDSFPTTSWSQVTQNAVEIPRAVATTTQISDLTPSHNTDVEGLKQLFEQLQATAKDQRKQDQETIQALRLGLEKQAAAIDALQALIQHVAPTLQKMASAFPTDHDMEDAPVTQDTPEEATGNDLQDLALKRNSDMELLTQEPVSAKRQDAKHSPGRKFFQ
jgi:hypothetical protein